MAAERGATWAGCAVIVDELPADAPARRALGAPHALVAAADLPPQGVTVADAATGRADRSHRKR
ncbi:hypothetical protein [Streptomyces sp. SBT349]|uniref:hypothetical protein n=1 Tax=Streptomyces sp. SBT349 TaxID=1580539 RepID=UPI00066E3A38|nr:hypothetical protein [Streptomyces sp. SBT349]